MKQIPVMKLNKIKTDEGDERFELTYVALIDSEQLSQIDKDLDQKSFFDKYHLDNVIWKAVTINGSPEVLFTLTD